MTPLSAAAAPRDGSLAVRGSWPRRAATTATTPRRRPTRARPPGRRPRTGRPRSTPATHRRPAPPRRSVRRCALGLDRGGHARPADRARRSGPATTTSTSPSGTGVVRVLGRRHACRPTPIVDIAGRRPRPTASGPARPRVLARRRPPLRQLHRQRTATPRSTSTTDAGAAEVDPAPRRERARGRPALRPTTTAATSSSAPTGCSTSASATAAAPATPSAAGPGHRARCWARSCASTPRPRAATAYAHPRRQPLRRRRRPARDLGLRRAQPVALLLRPRPPATCGSATSGQNEIEEIDLLPAGPSPAPTSAGTASRAPEPFEGAPPPDAVPPVFEYGRDEGCSVTGGYVYRGRPSPASTAPTSSATTAPAELLGPRASRTAGSPSATALGPGSGQRRLVSFAEDLDGELLRRCPSPAPSTGWSRRSR